MKEQIFKKIAELENEAVQFLVDICNIESPSENKEKVDQVGEYICKKAAEMNWQIEKQHQEVSGDCICITMNSDSKEQAVVLSGHMDTVHPIGLFGNPPVKMDEEKIYGPGVTDCKGGIVASFFAMKALFECGFTKRPIKLILQSDEEVSSTTSNKTTIEYMAEKSKDCIAFINCEGFNAGRATIQRKGISKYLLEVEGKAAHSSVCYNGISAISEASQKILELEKYKNPEGLTFNCGTITGGTVPNSVPAKCSFTLDVRFSTKKEMEEADKIVQQVAEKSFLDGTKCTVSILARRVAMERKDKNMDLLERINRIFESNDMPALAPNKVNGGSDAADMTAYGVPCVDSLGIEGKFIHSKEEFAYKKSMSETIQRLAIIAANM